MVKRTMDETTLRKYFPGASQSTIRRNAGAVGAVETNRPQRPSIPALDRSLQEPASRTPSLAIRLVAFRHRLLDEHDAVAYSCKPLTDAIADTLGVKDDDKRLRWEYSQIPTRGPEGTIVAISVL